MTFDALDLKPKRRPKRKDYDPSEGALFPCAPPPEPEQAALWPSILWHPYLQDGAHEKDGPPYLFKDWF